MFMKREPEERIERYAGPYERWVFTEELGRPFAFPAIAKGPSGYYTALMEGRGKPESTSDMEVRLPPLWNPSGKTRNVTPFAFHDRQMNDPRRQVQQDTTVARLLGTVRTKARSANSPLSPRFRVNFPVSPDAWVNDYREGEQPEGWVQPATQPKSIIGVIDDGLPFAHSSFLGTDGKTRISHCWLQSGHSQPTAAVPFGREFVNGEIDELIARFPNNERHLYRNAKATAPNMDELGNHLTRHATHGAHVLGLAAGNNSRFLGESLGDDIQIIAVQLPNTIAWDTSGFGKEMYMLSAIHYIFERARRIAEHFGTGELPLIVNFSYGWSAGRHDGQTEMELAMEELLEERQILQPISHIVMPTGNNFQSRMHARFREADFTQEQISLGWHLQPDDRTSSYLELWLPEGFDPIGYELELSAPFGSPALSTNSISISPDPELSGGDDGDPRRFAEIKINDQVIGQLSVDQHRGNRWRVMIALIPTVYRNGLGRKSPSGTWTITLKRHAGSNSLSAEDDILVWLQRDDDPSDLKTHGRQSYLIDLSNTQQAHSPKAPHQRYGQSLPTVSGFGATNAVATARKVTRVAGYQENTSRPSRYSGAGGLRISEDGTVSPWGVQPDVSAVSDQSSIRPGIPSIGTTTGSRSRLIGTSGAAPSVARLMVQNAALGNHLLEGFVTRLAFPVSEENSLDARAQHKACVGELTAPPVTR
ncbi:S8 family serine peptidase [Roseibium sediminis]|uniref:S8 family serine peptidase n=1 Tax=Roseibium sediminis TaxID=1775174 RepID=UPI00123D4C40|nr:S8 family serine peptidase [Roseibium sediminis]